MKNKKIPGWPVEAKAGLALVLTSAIIVGGALIIGSNSSSNHINPSDDIGMHTTSMPLSNTESMNPATMRYKLTKEQLLNGNKEIVINVYLYTWKFDLINSSPFAYYLRQISVEKK